jgi:hypothetical protein
VRNIATLDGDMFVSTSKKVFRLSGPDTGWEPYFELPFAGEIDLIKMTADVSGRKWLWIAGGGRLYRMDIDDLKVKSKKDKGKSVEDSGEPSILEVHQMAIEYAEVSPDKIRRWRQAARWKAIMPRLSVGLSESFNDNIEMYKNATTYYVVNGPRERDNDWSVDLSWDLSDLVWNDAQTSIDVRSKLMVQLRDDILEEVTRLYFERKRLIEEMAKLEKDLGEEAAVKQLEKRMRIEELTGYIDAYTGGEFSRALSKNSGC